MLDMRRRIGSRPSRPNLIVAAAAMGLALTACSGSGSDTTTTDQPAATTQATTTTTQATTTTQETTTTTVAAAPTLPVSPVGATVGDNPDNTYKVDLATFGALPFEDSELPARPGQVEVRWFTYQDRYVAAFVGLEVTDELCPGASILTQNGFEFVSNAPTTGDCAGFSTLTDDPLVEARVCEDVLFYVTLIPSDKTGTLFGTLEALAEPGVVVGLTSQSDSNAGAPALDLDGFCS